MSKVLTIALDVMGGDHGPAVVVPAALRFLKKRREGFKLLLVGDQDVIEKELARLGATGNSRLEIQHASQTVQMDELPSHALRFKKDSSMRVAIDMVKQGRAQACVSAGNTGALMATARFVLKTLPGIDRPAICTSLPSITGHTWMLDLGANIDSSPEHLFQFGLVGRLPGKFFADVADGAFQLHLARFLLFCQLFRPLFKLVIEGKPEDIAQHLLAPGGSLPGKLVGVPLAQVGAVDEGVIVHVQGVNNPLLCLGGSVAGNGAEAVAGIYLKFQRRLSRAALPLGTGAFADNAVELLPHPEIKLHGHFRLSGID